MYSQPAGFEPARGNPIGFQVQRLNHSATTADEHIPKFNKSIQVDVALGLSTQFPFYNAKSLTEIRLYVVEISRYNKILKNIL